MCFTPQYAVSSKYNYIARLEHRISGFYSMFVLAEIFNAMESLE